VSDITTVPKARFVSIIGKLSPLQQFDRIDQRGDVSAFEKVGSRPKNTSRVSHSRISRPPHLTPLLCCGGIGEIQFTPFASACPPTKGIEQDRPPIYRED
jgi:hypothetical protein